MSAWPYYAEDERRAVARVLESGEVNQWTGREVRAFEQEFADYHDVPHAVALCNGTVALELGLLALGLRDGDEVVTTPRTFIASSSCIALRGGRPVFADVDADSQNITPESVSRVLTSRTRAILAVHLAGWPCDMEGLRQLADEHDLMLIEDCAQAHGARFRGRPVGSFGDAAAFSFCQDKIMSTGGEGGMALFPDAQRWREAWSYKDHGKDWDAMFNTEQPPGFRWVHRSFGTNLRMTEMQAAIGRVQLGKLDQWVSARRANAGVLASRLGQLPTLRVPVPPEHVEHAYYKFYAFVRPDRLRASWTRDRVVAEINARGISCAHGSCPEVYLEAAFDDTGWRPASRLEVASALGETSLMLQVHPTLSESSMHGAADVITEVLKEASR